MIPSMDHALDLFIHWAPFFPSNCGTQKNIALTCFGFKKKNMVTNFAIFPEFYPEVSAGATLQQSLLPLLPLLPLLRLLRLFCTVLMGKWGFQPRSQVTQ
jgi:hypothetical protein